MAASLRDVFSGGEDEDGEGEEDEEEEDASDSQGMYPVDMGMEMQNVNDMSDETQPLKKQKRLCRYPGCNRVIKSQGHCQRHGARAKRCKVDGCTKQAQGTVSGL
jgi:hypothetical protein